MLYSKTLAVIIACSAVACTSAKDNSSSTATNTDAPAAKNVSVSDLPDPCTLVTDDEVSDLLWQGLDEGQRTALQAKNAKHTFTKRTEDVATPAGRTCYLSYVRASGNEKWGEGDFQLRTLGPDTFQMFANDTHSQEAIPGVGDQAFYMSNAAYGRKGDVGVEVVNFNSKSLEIELLKRAVSKLK